MQPSVMSDMVPHIPPRSVTTPSAQCQLRPSALVCFPTSNGVEGRAQHQVLCISKSSEDLNNNKNNNNNTTTEENNHKKKKILTNCSGCSRFSWGSWVSFQPRGSFSTIVP